MNSYFTVELLIGTFLGLLLAMVILLVLQVRTTNKVNKLTYPAYEYVIEKAEHDAEKLVQEAQHKAQSIIAAAQQAGAKTIADYTSQAKEIHTEYSTALHTQTESLEHAMQDISDEETAALQKVTDAAEDMITTQEKSVITNVEKTNQSIQQLVAQTEQGAKESIAHIEEQIAAVGDRLETQLKETDTTGQELLQKHIASLQGVADKHVEMYTDARIKLLDEHIEQLVESVVLDVLHTQLTPSEQASLAFKALQEAKAQHIL
jgi:F0F1-type ATP synthase membrane subunit b/b'